MAIADKEEILDFLTDTMRRTDSDITFANAFKAAELLGKYHGMFRDTNDGGCGDVIIIDDIGADKDSGKA